MTQCHYHDGNQWKQTEDTQDLLGEEILKAAPNHQPDVQHLMCDDGITEAHRDGKRGEIAEHQREQVSSVQQLEGIRRRCNCQASRDGASDDLETTAIGRSCGSTVISDEYSDHGEGHSDDHDRRQLGQAE